MKAIHSVGIVGLGLIGGSMARSIKKHTIATVYGYDLDPEAKEACQWMLGNVGGSLYVIRFYSRQLEPAEVAFNAALDQIRYFGADEAAAGYPAYVALGKNHMGRLAIPWRAKRSPVSRTPTESSIGTPL